MKMSKNGIIELANYEAMSNSVYLDSGGVRTIGIGMTLSEIPDIASWAWDKYLTDVECVGLYIKSLVKYENALNKVLLVEIPQHQYDALVSITYNIGTGGMAGSTFMKRLNKGDSPESVVSAMKAWNKDNGKVIKGLVNRRNAEGVVFLTGEYQNDGTVTHIEVDPRTHKPHYRGRVDISDCL